MRTDFSDAGRTLDIKKMKMRRTSCSNSVEYWVEHWAIDTRVFSHLRLLFFRDTELLPFFPRTVKSKKSCFPSTICLLQNQWPQNANKKCLSSKTEPWYVNFNETKQEVNWDTKNEKAVLICFEKRSAVLLFMERKSSWKTVFSVSARTWLQKKKYLLGRGTFSFLLLSRGKLNRMPFLCCGDLVGQLLVERNKYFFLQKDERIPIKEPWFPFQTEL